MLGNLVCKDWREPVLCIALSAMRTICDFDVTGSFHIIISRKMVNRRIGYIGNEGNVSMVVGARHSVS